jgi:hypothetical protein
MADETVTLKPEAVEVGKAVKDENASNLPYHNAETEKIAEDRAKDVDPNPPYAFTKNGYTVKEVAAVAPATTPTYEVVANGFSKTFTGRRDAEIYAGTHAPYVATHPVAKPLAKSSGMDGDAGAWTEAGDGLNYPKADHAVEEPSK